MIVSPTRHLRLSSMAAMFASFITLAMANRAMAAPSIRNLSLRGLQTGATTVLVIEGGDLASNPRVLLPIPIAGQSVNKDSKPNRIEVSIELAADTAPGIYPLRIASDSGISNPVLVAVDSLHQQKMAESTALPIALTGQLSGSDVGSVSFEGTKGQRVVVEVDARRLGSMVDPIVELLDARRVQLAWSQSLVALNGDARFETTLPADGQYHVEIHDALYRAGNPGFYRLKIGDLLAADAIFPMGVQIGAQQSVELIGSLPTDTKATIDLTESIGDTYASLPPLPGLTGSAPRVHASPYPQFVEPPPEKFQVLETAAPVVINGRLSSAKQTDRYQVRVQPGSKLKIDVLANRGGSPLDGILSVTDLAGKVLASNEDRPGTTDPGLDFVVPEGMTAIAVVVTDLLSRGGPEYVYQIAITPADQPDFQLTLFDDRQMTPLAGNAILRIRANRSGYGGPIALSFPNLPAGVLVSQSEIPANATDALVTLRGFGLRPEQSITTVVGSSTDPNIPLRRLALRNESNATTNQPWLRSDLGVAVTGPARLGIAWVTTDPYLPVGSAAEARVVVTRAPGVDGNVRLSLLTSQIVPRTPDNKQEDQNRALRLEGTPTISADQTSATLKILIPSDLPLLPYDLAIKAEVLGEDNKKVLATALTESVRLEAKTPFRLELAAANVEAKGGCGETGALSGKIVRFGKVDGPIGLTLVGLPAEVPPPVLEIAPGTTEFTFPIAFPYGTPAGDLANVRLVGASGSLRSSEVPVAVKVTAGEPPPPAPALLRIFEDEAYFTGVLYEGDAPISIEKNDRYSGESSLRLGKVQRFRTKMPNWGYKITEKPGENQFRYLRFAWKKKGGSNILLQLAADGKFGPTRGGEGPAFRYEAGPSDNPFSAAAIKIDEKLPEEWVVVTRDLFADFGEFSLDGIAFTPGEGEYGLFDHVYLARSIADFKECPPAHQQNGTLANKPAD